MPAVLDDQRQGDRLLLQFVAARLYAREIEDLVDQHQQVLSARMDVGRIIAIDRHAVLAEELAFHDFGKPQNGIERGAELVAHRGQKAALGQARLLGTPPRFIRVQLRLLEFDDQVVLLRLKRQRRPRGGVEPFRQDQEIELRATRDEQEREHLVARHQPRECRDRDGQRDETRIDPHGERRRDHGRQGADEQQDEEHERLRGGTVERRYQEDAAGPDDALDAFHGDEGGTPSTRPLVLAALFQKEMGYPGHEA